MKNRPRVVRWLSPRFSITNLLLLTAMAGIAAAWWQQYLQTEQARAELTSARARATELSNQLSRLQAMVPDPARHQFRSEGRFEEALAIFERALQAQSTPEAEKFQTIFYIGELASLTKQYNKAEKHLTRYIEYAQSSKNGNQVLLATAMDHLATCLRKQDRHEEALELYYETLEIKEASTPGSWTIPNLKRGMGQCFLDLGRYEEAEKTLIQAHRGLVARESSIWGPQKASHIGLAAKYLVKLYEAWGRPDEADHWRRELEAVTAKYQAQTATAKRF